MRLPASLRFLRPWLVISSLILLYACGGGGGSATAPPPAVSTYSLSGSVSGAVQQGVVVSLTGAATATATTGSSGTYTFTGLANGSYTVTPSLAGYIFSPASTSVTVNGANVSATVFVSALAVGSYTLAGTVSGAVQQGVQVNLTGAATATATTDASGNYSFAGLANGGYTVTPTLTGYTFTPASLAVTLNGASAGANNFTAAAVPAGSTWTLRTSGTTNNLNDIVWSGSQYVAVGSRNTVLTSPDGITWTSRSTGAPLDFWNAPYDLFGVAWSGTRFVAVGMDSYGFNGIILTSPDGVTWTTQVSGPSSGNPTTTTNPYTLVKVIWASGRFVAVGTNSNGSSGAILTSADGLSWTPQTLSTTYSGLNNVTWTGSRFVAVGASGTIETSPDAGTWTGSAVGTSPYGLYGIAWSGSLFVATGMSTGGGTPIVTSPDAITWTARTSTAGDLWGVIWDGTQFLTAQASGYGAILTSPDGITWTEQASSVGASYGLLAITGSGPRHVAVGTGGTILTLP